MFEPHRPCFGGVRARLFIEACRGEDSYSIRQRLVWAEFDAETIECSSELSVWYDGLAGGVGYAVFKKKPKGSALPIRDFQLNSLTVPCDTPFMGLDFTAVRRTECLDKSRQRQPRTPVTDLSDNNTIH